MARMPALVTAATAALALGCCTKVTVPTGPRATSVEELVVEPGEATALSVETKAGDIHLGPCLKERGAMTVLATKSAATREDLARIHPFARVEGDTIRVGYTADPGTDGVGVSFAMEPPEVLRIRLKTSAGSLRTIRVRGELLLETSAGNIVVEGADGTVDAEASAGDIEVAGRLRGRCRLETDAGNVEASIPADSRLRILGHTNAGNARSELSVGAGSAFASANIVGTLGDGSDGTLELKTSAGDIALKKLP